MKINWSAFLTNPAYQIGGVLAVLLAVGIVAGVQQSCGKHHEETAKVEEVKADAAHERLKDALQEIEGLHRKVADLEEAGRRYRALYLEARNHIPPPPKPPPADRVELAKALEGEGIAVGVVVAVGIPASTFTESDAGLVYTASQRAKRADALEQALKACDELQAQQDATLKAKDLEMSKINEALRASMEESVHRQMQAVELGKALTIEKKKGWQRYGLLAAGVVGGYLAGKK